MVVLAGRAPPLPGRHVDGCEVGGADTFHKPGLKMQAKILHHLFVVVDTDVIKAPLWDAAAQGPAAFPSNVAYVQQQVSQLLATSFPNMRPQQVEVRRLVSLAPRPPHPSPCSERARSGGTRPWAVGTERPACIWQACVQGMFTVKDFSAFKQHLRDFLVQTKAFATQDNTALFADEQVQLKQASAVLDFLVPRRRRHAALSPVLKRISEERTLFRAEALYAAPQAERQQMAKIPGMLHPHEAGAEETMGD